MAKGKIMVRLENIADIFDMVNQMEHPQIKTFNMKLFAKYFFIEANPGVKEVPEFTIKEVSLSGNQLVNVKDDYMNKYRWLSEDNSKLPNVTKPADSGDFTALALESQRIRTFEIEYSLP